jgi:hypothetical protein
MKNAVVDGEFVLDDGSLILNTLWWKEKAGF